MEKQEKLYVQSSVWKAIASMALPAMVTIVVMVLYNMADTFFIGMLGDNAQVAAVSVTAPLFSLIMAVGSLLGGGGAPVVAKALGRGDRKQVQLYSSLCCWGSIVFSVLLSVLLLIFRMPILDFLGTNEEIKGYALEYLIVLIPGAPAMIFSTTMSNILRCEGAIKESMIGVILSTILNLILDPLFIFGMGMGVQGAALATVLGNVAGCLYLLWYFRTHTTCVSLSLRTALSNPLALGTILAVGLPNLASTVLGSISGAVANQLLVSYGTATVAAMAAASKSTLLIGMLQMGLCIGVQPMMAYLYGAGNQARLKETLIKLTLLTILVGTGLSMFCFFGSGTVVGLFLKDPMAVELGRNMVRILVISGPFLGLFYVGSSYLQASGEAMQATGVSVLRQGLLLIPLLYLMNHIFGLYGNLYAHLFSDLLACGISMLFMYLQYRHSFTKESRCESLLNEV